MRTSYSFPSPPLHALLHHPPLAAAANWRQITTSLPASSSTSSSRTVKGGKSQAFRQLQFQFERTGLPPSPSPLSIALLTSSSPLSLSVIGFDRQTNNSTEYWIPNSEYRMHTASFMNQFGCYSDWDTFLLRNPIWSGKRSPNWWSIELRQLQKLFNIIYTFFSEMSDLGYNVFNNICVVEMRKEFTDLG